MAVVARTERDEWSRGFINSSGQTLHVWFGGDNAPRFYVPAGIEGAKVQFDKPGTYEYSRT